MMGKTREKQNQKKTFLFSLKLYSNLFCVKILYILQRNEEIHNSLVLFLNTRGLCLHSNQQKMEKGRFQLMVQMLFIVSV